MLTCGAHVDSSRDVKLKGSPFLDEGTTEAQASHLVIKLPHYGLELHPLDATEDTRRPNIPTTTAGTRSAASERNTPAVVVEAPALLVVVLLPLAVLVLFVVGRLVVVV